MTPFLLIIVEEYKWYDYWYAGHTIYPEANSYRTILDHVQSEARTAIQALLENKLTFSEKDNTYRFIGSI